MDETETKQTREERAEDRAHYAHESRIHNAVTLTAAAMQHGGLHSDMADGYLRGIHATLSELASPPKPETPAAPEPLKPAVPVKKSVTPEAIISLLDGRPRLTLTRHLKLHGHTPESYRAAFGLPDSYPMVAAAYTAKRAAIAKTQGFGTRTAKSAPAAAH